MTDLFALHHVLLEANYFMRTFYIGERPYVCDQCGISYAHPNGLSKHKMSIHQGIRPHACQVCDKRFITKMRLNEHLVIHTGEKSFLCDQCDKRFNRASNLRTHKSRVHHQKIYSHRCPVCDKCFYNTTELKNHSVTHTGVHLFGLNMFYVRYIFRIT